MSFLDGLTMFLSFQISCILHKFAGILSLPWIVQEDMGKFADLKVGDQREMFKKYCKLKSWSWAGCSCALSCHRHQPSPRHRNCGSSLPRFAGFARANSPSWRAFGPAFRSEGAARASSRRRRAYCCLDCSGSDCASSGQQTG